MILDAFSAAPFTTLLAGHDFARFQDKCKELRTAGSALQKFCANLNLKVQKWKGASPEVMEYLQKLRRRAVVLADSLRVLCPDAGHGSDTVSMEAIISNLVEHLGNVPVSFIVVVYMRDRAQDFDQIRRY